MEFNKKRILQAAGDKLVVFRKKFEYSRTQMATHFGVTRSAYYKNEKGMTLPNLETLHRMAMEYNISMDWFFFSRGPMYYDDKEKIKEIEELRSQLELEQNKQLAQENAKQKEKEANQAEAAIKPEIKELVKDMETVPLLYYEILAHYQRFKIENKTLIETIE